MAANDTTRVVLASDPVVSSAVPASCKDPRIAPRAENRALRGALVTLLFVGLTFLFAYPVSRHPGSLAFKSADSLLNSWVIGWVSKSLFTDPANLFDGNICYPHSRVIANTENMLGVVPIAAPVFWLSGNAMLAHNVVLLVSFVLCGIGTYLLVRHLTGSTAAGILGGIIFAFAPYKMAQIVHVQELNAHWMPLGLLCLHRAFDTRRWRDFAGFGACFTLQAMSCLYYATYFAFAVGLFVLCFVLMRRRAVSVSLAMKFIAVCVLSAVALIPVALPYLLIQRERRSFGVSESRQQFSATLEDYLTTTPGNKLYGALTAPLRPAIFTEHVLFPGVLPVVLALIAAGGLLYARWRRRGETVRGVAEIASDHTAFEPLYYGLLGLCAFVFTLGSNLHVMSRVFDFPMPYRLFEMLMPGAKGMRVTSRFDVLVMLSLAVFAGYGLTYLLSLSWLRCCHIDGLWGGTVGTIISSLAIAGVCVEYADRPIVMTTPSGRNIPAVYGWLENQPDDPVIAEIPAPNDVVNSWYEYYSTYHWRRIVNGHNAIVERLDGLPDVEVLDLLRVINVHFLVFHPNLYPDSLTAMQIRSRLDASSELQLVQTFDADGDRVYRVLIADHPDKGNAGMTTTRPAGIKLEPVLPRVVRAGELFSIPIRASFLFPLGRFIRSDRVVTGSLSFDGGETKNIECLFPIISVLLGSVDDRAIDVVAPSDVGSHRLKIRLKGPRGEIEEDRVIAVVDSKAMGDSLGRQGLRAEITLGASCDTRAKAGGRFRIDAEVKNVGDALWLAKTRDDDRGWVGVRVWKWADERGNEVRGAGGKPLGGRVMLRRPLWPGQALRARIYAVAPASPGKYTVTVDVCSEAVAWFGLIKASVPQQLSVTVE